MSTKNDKQKVVDYILNSPKIVSGEDALRKTVQQHGDIKSTYSFLVWRF